MGRLWGIRWISRTDEGEARTTEISVGPPHHTEIRYRGSEPIALSGIFKPKYAHGYRVSEKAAAPTGASTDVATCGKTFDEFDASIGNPVREGHREILGPAFTARHIESHAFDLLIDE
jgi:hypothetical protein